MGPLFAVFGHAILLSWDTGHAATTTAWPPIVPHGTAQGLVLVARSSEQAQAWATDSRLHKAEPASIAVGADCNHS